MSDVQSELVREPRVPFSGFLVYDTLFLYRYSLGSLFIPKEWQRASCTAGDEFWRISFLGEFLSLYLSANFQKCMNRETGRGENTPHDC